MNAKNTIEVKLFLFLCRGCIRKIINKLVVLSLRTIYNHIYNEISV